MASSSLNFNGFDNFPIPPNFYFLFPWFRRNFPIELPFTGIACKAIPARQNTIHDLLL